MDGIAYSFSVAILPDLSKDLKLPESKVTVISAVQLGTYYLFGPVACAIVNHYGFRAVGIFGCVIAFAGIFIASHVTSFTAIIALYGVIGQRCAIEFSFLRITNSVFICHRGIRFWNDLHCLNY